MPPSGPGPSWLFALTYAQLVDGFWLGRLSDNEAYSPEVARDIVCDWLRDLFGENRETPAHGTAVRKSRLKSETRMPARKIAGKKKP